MSGALRLRLCASATEIIDTDVIDCGWEPEDGEDEYPTIRAHWKGRALLVTPESAEAVARELNALSNLCDDTRLASIPKGIKYHTYPSISSLRLAATTHDWL